MQPFDQLLPSAVFIAGTAALVLALKVMRQPRAARAPETAPGPREAHPAPGAAEQAALKLLDARITAFTISTYALPVILCAAVILPVSVGGADFDRVAMAAATAIAAASYSYSLARLIQLIRRRRDLRLRSEGKTAVGLALAELGTGGYRAFHDFSADTMAIDHILVGPTGVFAVKTLTQARSGNSKRIEDATVTYNGHALFFRSRADAATIQHAQQQADRLSEWIGREVGEEVAVRPIVVVPGWFVQRKTPEGLPVVNPRQIPSLFKYIIPRPLAPEQIARISLLLERICLRRNPA